MSTEIPAPTATSTTTAATSDQTQNVTPAAPAATSTPAPAAAAPATPSADPAKPPAETPQTPPPKADPAVPVKYEVKLKDGSPLDPAHVETVISIAKEKGLSNEQAQLLLDRENDAVVKFQSDQIALAEKRKGEYFAETTADKEIGGANVKENVALASRVVAKFGSEKLVKELETTGLGNYSEIVRVFARIGKAMGEDKMVIAPAGNSSAKTREEKFYGTSTSQPQKQT